MEAMEQADSDQNIESPELTAMAKELETALAAGHAARLPLPWDNYVRSLFLLIMVGILGYLAYQPSRLRISMLWSFASPSQGESLNWKPNPIPPEPAREIIKSPTPAEWRLTPAYSTSLTGGKKANTRFAGLISGAVAKNAWPRFSANPWNWQDDALSGRKEESLAAIQPPQKSASPFRAGEHEVWPETRPEPVVTEAMQPAISGGSVLPPLVSPPPGQTPVTASAPAQIALPPFGNTPTQPAANPTLPTVDGNAQLPPLGALNPIQPAGSQQTPTPATTPAAPEQPQVDWKNTEITGPIPGAYLTIYPKLKFVGICVPGQGYVRKYNQIGVPADLTSRKMTARDGKTPYGRYYIADRHRDNDGPRLYLSWPAPEDGQRIGLDAGIMAQIVNAWRRQELPPQDTPAGGGVGLNGLRNWVEVTEGGFALEEPHMEEIFTALPDKAWVFIQE